jgi:hypothetical protein
MFRAPYLVSSVKTSVRVGDFRAAMTLTAGSTISSTRNRNLRRLFLRELFTGRLQSEAGL